MLGRVGWCLLCVLCCVGCRRDQDGDTAHQKGKILASCVREAVLGVVPVLGGACVRDNDCGMERAAWRRCLAGRCLGSHTKEDQGHQAAVRAAIFVSPRVIASGDEAGVIWLWRRDSMRWRPWRRWRAHKDAVLALALGPLGQIFSGSVGEVRVWDLRAKGFVGHWLVRGEVQSIAWSSSQERLAVASTDRLVRWRRWPETKRVQRLTKEGWMGEEKVCDVIRSLSWEKGKQGRLAGVGDDGLLYVWSWKGSSLPQTLYLAGHRGWVRRVQWWGASPVTTGFDQTLRVWDFSKKHSLRLGRWGASLPLVLEKVRRCVSRLPVSMWSEEARGEKSMMQGDPLGLAIFPKRSLVVVGSHRRGWMRFPDPQGSRVVVWSLRTAQPRCHAQEHLLGVRVIARSPASLRWVSGSDDGTLRVYRIEGGKK